jgi:hypothetical protein
MLVRRYSSGSAQPGDNCSNDLNIFSTQSRALNDMFDVYEGWTLDKTMAQYHSMLKPSRGRLSSTKERRINNKSMLSSVFNVYPGPAA